MAVRDILLLGNPVLWKPSKPVTDVKSRQTGEIIAHLSDTLADFVSRHGFGRGIAAPQIGVLQRIIFIDVGQPLPMINPSVVKASAEQMELWDDCFSFPDLMVRVKRSVEITVNFTRQSGEEQQLEARNGLSELLQHEIDHLDGILATDRAIDARSFALRTEIAKG